jgi:hypothetical protein
MMKGRRGELEEERGSMVTSKVQRRTTEVGVNREKWKREKTEKGGKGSE